MGFNYSNLNIVFENHLLVKLKLEHAPLGLELYIFGISLLEKFIKKWCKISFSYMNNLSLKCFFRRRKNIALIMTTFHESNNNRI